MTTELRDPQTATNLDELCEILNEWAEAIAYQDGVDDYPSDLTALPVFGEDWNNPVGVWSWDTDRVIVSGPQITVEVSGWEIQPRCDHE